MSLVRTQIFGQKYVRGHLIAKRFNILANILNLGYIPSSLSYEYILFNSTKQRIISQGTHTNYLNVDIDASDIGDDIELYLDVDITTITYVHFLNNSDFDRVDVRGFTSVTTVDIYNNGCEELLLFNNTSLKRIFTGGNSQLQQLNLSEVPKLDHFTMQGNTLLTSLNFSNNPLLRWLDITNMVNLVSLNLDNCITKLYRIFANNCSVTGILNLSNRPKLYSFIFDDNSLTKIIANNNPKFNYATISNNNVVEIDFSNNNIMRAIYGNNNNISILSLPQFNNLITLELSNNNINQDIDLSNVMYSVSNAIKLNDNDILKLNCAFNGLTNIGTNNFNTTNNQNLTCIQVRTQDLNYAQTNFTNIDTQTIIGDTPC